MCLIGFALDCHPDYRLIVAGNRDENYDRPTEPAGWWPRHSDVHGGRDLQAGGSWMALNRDGRMAAVTNYRQPASAAAPAGEDGVRRLPSRGTLVDEFVTPRSINGIERERFIARHRARVTARAGDYAGFNLLLFSLDASATRAWWLGNRANPDDVPVDQVVTPGVHGLSNALLDTRWPKSVALTQAIERTLTIRDGRRVEAVLFEALADREPCPDDRLPDTGVGLLRERLLAPAFIATPHYGTRASTVVLVDRQDRVDYIERSFLPDGRFTHRHTRFGLQRT